MPLADAFLQSIQVINFFYQYVCSLGIEPTTFNAANAMLYHWATGTLVKNIFHARDININITYYKFVLYVFSSIRL